MSSRYDIGRSSRVTQIDLRHDANDDAIDGGVIDKVHYAPAAAVTNNL